MPKVAIFIGSLRKESFSRKVAENVAGLFPKKYETVYADIGELPLYNQDYDEVTGVPEAYKTFRNMMKSVDAVLFVTPEYNRSVPGVLKNAIDVGSRPKESSVWNEKPAAIISVAPGTLSGFGANHHLRQSLVFFNMPVVQQPEAYIGNVKSLLDEKGKINNQNTLHFLQSFVDSFTELIDKHN